MPSEPRPDPDALLAAVQQERSPQRGQLKLFFGMCPGVGKTYAMLQEARRRHAAGVEVLVGIVETHGRAETEALIEGLAIVPRARLEYRGTVQEELDLDAILLWHPPLVIVDELAHTNAPGSRHRKRYQDVLELLEAGIDVYSAMNVQHLESRRDTVQQITGIAMRETVPDSVLEAADEIILIDLTPAQLRSRLAEGKVYVGARATAAAENFFQESNLLALREMALRVVAEHVDRDLRYALQEHQRAGPWKSSDRLLVAVGASPFSEKLIRYACRLSGTMEATWLAVHIDQGHRLTEPDQARLAHHLALARQLGGEVISTTAVSVGEALLRVAQQHHVSQIILGKPLGFSWLRRTSPTEWLIRHSGGIDLHLIRSEEAAAPGWAARWRRFRPAPAGAYATALLIAAAVTGLGWGVLEVVGYWAVALLYLLAVTLSATLLRRGPILLLATASALLWDYLFIPPRFHFSVTHLHDAIMLGLYFVVATVVGHLTTRLREREQAERQAEERATALYRLTRAMAASSTLGEAIRVVVQQLRATLQVPSAILLQEPSGLAPHPESTLALSPKEESVGAWSYQRKQAAGRFTDTLPEAEAFHLPLLVGNQCEGVLALPLSAALTVERRELLEAMTSQLAAFIQKDRAVQKVREAQLAAQSHKLQKALFDSVSHELKTPLATALGLLEQAEPSYAGIQQAVQRLSRTVDHLLDATRLESGLLRPRLEWCAPGELGQEAIALAHLPDSKVQTTSSAELPMIRVDAGLVAQALSLLLVNAATHAPAGQAVELHLAHEGDSVIFSVLDRGPGLRAGEEEKIFTKFYRGAGAQPGGLGLGLSIARQLVDLHGGTLRAQNRPGGGALFRLRLPATESLRLPEEPPA